jgi:hypothetical protein
LQAWVVFADIGAATNALRGMQNFPFFDKPMVSWRAFLPAAQAICSLGLLFAWKHGPSADAMALVMPRVVVSAVRNAPGGRSSSNAGANTALTALSPPLPPAFATLLQRVGFAKTTSNAVAAQKGGKAGRGKAAKGPAAAAAAAAGAEGGEKGKAAARQQGGAAAAAGGEDLGRPGNKLFVEGLPAATTAAMLEMLFQQFPGGWGRLVCKGGGGPVGQ